MHIRSLKVLRNPAAKKCLLQPWSVLAEALKLVCESRSRGQEGRGMKSGPKNGMQLPAGGNNQEV